MNIKDIFTNVKTYWAIFGIVLTVGSVVGGYLVLPSKVEAIEKDIVVVKEDVEINEDSVQKLASTVDIYIAEQKVYKESQDKREALLLEWLKERRGNDG